MVAFADLRNGQAFRVVPPLAESFDESPGAPWAALHQPNLGNLGQPWEGIFEQLVTAYASADSADLAAAAAALAEAQVERGGAYVPEAWRIQAEHHYLTLHPFRWAWIFCALTVITLLVTTKRWSSAGYKIAWILAVGAVLIQIAGFVARMIISSRPPVTNMYESVIWVAFGAVVLGLAMEAVHRSRHFLLAASLVALLSLYLADAQGGGALDRAINPLQPVLQDNFWLTTHVLTVTLSYAAFALALGLAHIVIFPAIWKGHTKSVRSLYPYIYRSIQVGVFLLATGVVLGAFWANYSWGRFWDWDPKETWSLVALLSYLALLHGRLAGWWGGFGMAIGSVLGFLTILMAWYGVNFVLGVGLHSYGFGEGGYGLALGFLIFQLALVVVALIRVSGGNRRTPTTPMANAIAD